MNTQSHIPEDRTERLIDIFSRIPVGAREYCTDIFIHMDGAVNFSRLSSFIQGKVIHIINSSVPTKQHKRHLGFERIDRELHIDLF